MSIRCGFFNSIGNDRRYDAEDMGKLFDGVISDGVFATKNDVFKIQAIRDTMNIEVLSGKAWFNGKYFEIEKNTTEEKTLEAASTLPRYDAVYIQIDNTQSEGGRVGSIEILTGLAAQDPKKPLVTSTETQTKIVIGYVKVLANATNLNSAIITSNVGVKEANPPEEPNACPYSEPSLDPRRAVYAYEGESEIDPTINEIVTWKDSGQVSRYHKITTYYPTGFTYDNTMIIQMLFSVEDPELYGWRSYPDTYFELLTDRIEISLSDDIPYQSNIYYKISLMKREEESQNE